MFVRHTEFKKNGTHADQQAGSTVCAHVAIQNGL